MEIIFVTIEEALYIHSRMIREYGGEEGLRDRILLESAITVPQSGMFGKFFHTDLYEMAAAYLYHLVKNHPFVDGNKRTGATVALVFLAGNRITLTLTQKEFYEVVLEVAVGSIDKPELAEILRKHAKSLA
ncbi:MAG: type II toxin-antitoxin system death-on-curing family toxin [Planctomycetaceae bacterium]|nr:type II toxin-antitoxin system death-on-curing family toxin [Planctomycetaceae bacterium]